jgi:putative ABC transport system substrate-binding protein
MRRREFLGGLAGTAVAWPLASRAQQRERVQRIGALMNLAENDPEGQARVAAFQQALQQLGWIENRNVRFDIRWGAGNQERYRQYAAELVALSPDVILAAATSVLPWLLQATRTIPVVFTQVTDPVGAGYVKSLARPGGNATGFANFDFNLSGKWLELLKEVSPGVTRVAVVRNPSASSGIAQFATIQAMAPSLGVTVRPIDVTGADDIEGAIATFAREPNSGLIVLIGAVSAHRGPILALAARHRLPAIYPFRYFVTDGGLLSYGPDSVDPYRRAAEYVDRVLKGEKPTDLPVQVATRYQLVINLKTAKALGLAVPPTLLARADEVIE